MATNREMKLFDVLEEVREKEFSDLPATLVREILAIHVDAVRDGATLSETRKRIEANIREHGASE